MLWIMLIVLAIIAIVFFALKYKRIRYGNLVLVTGGVKTGKTQLCVALVIKRYRKQLRAWKRRYFWCKLTRKELPEKPLLYSNMPIGRKGDTYVPLTVELVTQEHRFAYGSVIYYNEASLIAGSKDIRDEDLNDHLLQFFKLCAHFTKGGYVFLDTQCVHDIHYTTKRSLSTYFDIWRSVKLPFVSLMWLRENKLVDGDNTVAIDMQIDPQDSPLEGGKPLYFTLVRNKWWKYYDRYAYSDFVKHLPCEYTEVRVTDNKKVAFMVRCRDIKSKLKERKT